MMIVGFRQHRDEQVAVEKGIGLQESCSRPASNAALASSRLTGSSTGGPSQGRSELNQPTHFGDRLLRHITTQRVFNDCSKSLLK